MARPDNFAVLAGDVKLEHIPTLCALYELERNLWIDTNEGRLRMSCSPHAVGLWLNFRLKECGRQLPTILSTK